MSAFSTTDLPFVRAASPVAALLPSEQSVGNSSRKGMGTPRGDLFQ
jgi:hypothetical protein